MKTMRYVLIGLLVLCMTASLCACDGDVPQNDTDATTTATTVQTTDAPTTQETTTTTDVTTTTTTAAEELTTTTDVTEETTAPTDTDSEETDIIGTGTKDDPYLETPNLDTMTVETVSIPAGESVFYGIYRVGNMTLTIDDPSAYVVCEDVRYDAENGVVTFTVPNVLASDAVPFEIGNSGSEAAVFTVAFANQKGSQMDPEIVDTLDADHKVSLAEEASTGYYYRYTAEKAGTIRFYMTATVESMLYATNNRNSAQRSTEEDANTDADGKTYIELAVEAGDEIIINVAAKPSRRGNYPATEITWNGVYQ